ncbi:hypothetical protein [Huaxiibacter chinensis]|uniref:hypothetical protein n=1 Tax=Huaxiibacter chinensis TaxID=2899785 RepID=UPI003D3231A6
MQKRLKSIVVTSALTLVVGTATAAPTTDLPQAPAKSTQNIPKVVEKIVDKAYRKGADKEHVASVSPESAPKLQATVPSVSSEPGDNASAKSGAEMTPNAPTDAAGGSGSQNLDVKPAAVDNTTQVQNHLAQMAEDDFVYEQQRRKLSQQVELEKLQSQIRKLRGEDKMKPAPVASAPVEKPADAPKVAPQSAPVDMPRVVLEANIGGANRVAVTSGGTLRYVRPGETFAINGNNYQLAKDRKSVVMAEEKVQ